MKSKPKLQIAGETNMISTRFENGSFCNIVPLKYCEYDKKNRVLKLASEWFGGAMPPQFYVLSHHTQREVRFVVVGPEDILYNPDGWDGEQQVYRPMGTVPNVECLVVYHQY